LNIPSPVGISTSNKSGNKSLPSSSLKCVKSFKSRSSSDVGNIFSSSLLSSSSPDKDDKSESFISLCHSNGVGD